MSEAPIDMEMIATGMRLRGDTSVDTSEGDPERPPTERQHVSEVFGAEYLTNPAGEPLPDVDDVDNRFVTGDTRGDFNGAAASGDASEQRMSAADEEDGQEDDDGYTGLASAGELAALEAADVAHHAGGGGGESAVLDALEAAEATYGRAHPDEASAGPASLTGRPRSPQASGTGGSASPRAADLVSDDARAAARTRLAAAFGRNPRLQRSVESAAVAVEAEIYSATSASRGAYRAALANAVRLAPQGDDPAECARVALGRPKVEPDTREPIPAASSGLTGSVIKPYYT